MKDIILGVAGSTKSAINKVSRSIRQSSPDHELVTSLSKLVDSFSKLISVTREQPEGGNYYEQMEREVQEENKNHKTKIKE